MLIYKKHKAFVKTDFNSLLKQTQKSKHKNVTFTVPFIQKNVTNEEAKSQNHSKEKYPFIEIESDMIDMTE